MAEGRRRARRGLVAAKAAEATIGERWRWRRGGGDGEGGGWKVGGGGDGRPKATGGDERKW